MFTLLKKKKLLKFKKNITLLAFTIFATVKMSSAQFDYHPDAGLSVFFTEYSTAITLTYWARLNLVEISDEIALSGSAIPSIGGQLNSEEGSYLGVDLPITLDLNIGNRATINSNSAIGFFVGGGFGVNFMGRVNGNTSSITTSTGPILQGGIRSTCEWFGNKNHLALKFSYLVGLGEVEEINPSVIGIGLYFGFGH